MAVEITDAKAYFDQLWEEAQGDTIPVQTVEEPTVELIGYMPEPEAIIEKAGRVCWLSYDKVKEGSAGKFVARLVKNQHGSVLEHSYAVFAIEGGSRAFTHQLVRHRLTSVSQQSQRYVDEQEFRVIMPPSIASNPKAEALFKLFIRFAKLTYRALKAMGCKNEDARYVLPNAVESRIVIGANFREWRHIIRERAYKNAQWEIKHIALRILEILREHAPHAFDDFELRVDEDGQTYAFQTKSAAYEEGWH